VETPKTRANPRRSPTPQERQRDPERTKKLILDAATAEFAAHGYAGARIGAIAGRAGVNQQLISYYFGGKEGLYQAISDGWRERQKELSAPDAPLSEQIRQYTLEALHNPDGVRLLAWNGLEYAGPEADPDHEATTHQLQSGVEDFRERQHAGQLPEGVDPACLMVMLMAAAMATTTLPHVIEGICQADPHSPEFVHHYADQLAKVVGLLGLDPEKA
jgi:AcrR family transcriptional regulator